MLDSHETVITKHHSTGNPDYYIEEIRFVRGGDHDFWLAQTGTEKRTYLGSSLAKAELRAQEMISVM